jgi:hypothetical protein
MPEFPRAAPAGLNSSFLEDEEEEALRTERLESVRKWLDEIPDFGSRADVLNPRNSSSFKNSSSASSAETVELPDWEDPSLRTALQKRYKKKGMLGWLKDLCKLRNGGKMSRTDGQISRLKSA